MKIIIINNYDSFTYNLYQLVAEITKDLPLVYNNDQLTYKQFSKIQPDAIVISPGPGNPENKKDFGISYEIIKNMQIPILGVCLGHQGIASVFGAKIINAPVVFHGKQSLIYHQGDGLFQDIPQGFTAMRYHSLMIDKNNIPKELQKTAWTKDSVIMGIKHVTKPLFGVQFHPESIGTKYGKKLLENFINLAKNYEKKS